jgi:anti-anti-sigma factor
MRSDPRGIRSSACADRAPSSPIDLSRSEIFMTAVLTTMDTERGLPARTIIELRGDLDLAAAPALREHLLDVLRHSTNLLILDLSGVMFCDASGLAVLVGAQHRAQLLGVSLAVAAPRPQIAKVLRITGLDRSLAIYPTVSEALARATATPLGRPALLPADRWN